LPFNFEMYVKSTYKYNVKCVDNCVPILKYTTDYRFVLQFFDRTCLIFFKGMLSIIYIMYFLSEFIQ